MTTEAEVGVMWPQAKGHQELPEASRAEELILSQSLWRGYSPADTLILDFWPPQL